MRQHGIISSSGSEASASARAKRPSGPIRPRSAECIAFIADRHVPDTWRRVGEMTTPHGRLMLTALDGLTEGMTPCAAWTIRVTCAASTALMCSAIYSGNGALSAKGNASAAPDRCEPSPLTPSRGPCRPCPPAARAPGVFQRVTEGIAPGVTSLRHRILFCCLGNKIRIVS